MGPVITIFGVVAVYFIINRLCCFWCRSNVCLIGKTAIVTGGASGMGYHTVSALAAKGCRVIIADVVHLTAIVETLKKETHNANILGYQVDLQSFKSVRKFAADMIATESTLNMLICNAGVSEYGNGKYTEDGLQKTMQINYFSHFLLTHLLLDLLKKSSPSRIIFTSSIVAYISLLEVRTLNPQFKYFSTYKNLLTEGCYSNSKLALAIAAKIFSEKLTGTGVTVNTVHPGGVKTSLYRSNFKTEGSLLLLFGWFVVSLFGKNSEEGAQTIIYLAQSDKVKDITGQSFYEGMRVPRPFQLNNEEFCQKIWEKSIEYTNLELKM